MPRRLRSRDCSRLLVLGMVGHSECYPFVAVYSPVRKPYGGAYGQRRGVTIDISLALLVV